MSIASLESIYCRGRVILRYVFDVTFRRWRDVIVHLITLCIRYLLMKDLSLTVVLHILLLKSVLIQASIWSVVSNFFFISLLILVLSLRLMIVSAFVSCSSLILLLQVLLDETWFCCDRKLRKTRRRCSCSLHFFDQVLHVSSPPLVFRCSNLMNTDDDHALSCLFRHHSRTGRYTAPPDSSSLSRSALHPSSSSQSLSESYAKTIS